MLGAASSDNGFNHLEPRGRRGPLGHPGVLLLAAAALFSMYALRYIPELGSLFEYAMRSSRDSTFPALNPAFYGIAGLAAFLVLLALLRFVDLLLHKFRKTAPLAKRPLKPLPQFLEEAAVGKISLRVARESYYLLAPHYPQAMCIDLTDSLRGDLLLSDEEIRVLDAQLLTRCDRRDAPTSMADAFTVMTVFDLLYRVETTAPLRAKRPSGTRDRSTDNSTENAIDLPAAFSRNPSSAQRKALHTAALLAIESRALPSAKAAGLHRRSSDYEGPRRRATDNQAEPVHKGPFRRSTDGPMTEIKAKPPQTRRS